MQSPVPQTRVPGTKLLHQHHSLAGCVCRSTVHNTTILDGGGPCAETLRLAMQSGALSNTAVPAPREFHPNPTDGIPVKQSCLPPVQETVESIAGAHTSPLFDRRIKLFFASELNSVLFYWLEWVQAKGLLRGTYSGRSVILVALQNNMLRFPIHYLVLQPCLQA